ncbi:hypothetical protein ACH5RR_005304 [Cinchona calisaya]|uniref:BHLH domain-containing protein n=1 Tax=Cinchona calisaya TaxID=153742 RepID=A0ABD3AL12_9GENT
MMLTPLREFLQSLCSNSPWDYAVFWKFQQRQNQMLLVWDDGLFDFSKPIDLTEGIMQSVSFNSSNERFSSACALSPQNGNLGDCPIEVAMAEMSSTYYVMGKGLVGEVACTESPSWIFVDNFMAGRFNCNLISECPNELFHQFVAGVKTMLLVPLVPHGVLQLGSLDMVLEDATQVINVKHKFYAHLQFGACFSPFMSDRNLQVQPTELMCTYMENFGESSCTAMIKIDEDLKVLGTAGIEGQQMLNTNQIMSTVQHSDEIFQKGRIIDQGSENKINMQSVSLVDVAMPFDHQIWEISESEMMQNLIGSCVNAELDCFSNEELVCFSNFSGYRLWNSENPVDKIMHPCPNDGIMEPSFVVKDCKTASRENGSQNLKFPTDCELHKALGHVLLNHADLDLSNVSASASSVSKEDTIHINDPSAWGLNKNKVENLLEAVVTNASCISDNSSSNRSLCATSFKLSSMKFGSSQVEEGASREENHVPLSCVTSAFSGDRNLAIASSPSASSFGNVLNDLLEQQPQKTGNGPVCLTKVSKLTEANKRRARSNDNQKPRPRDRQLIQDRLKELRELVPNGAKCSIDGLLDKTIKHMQFLASVTDQADKIRQHIVKKESNQKDVKLPIVESTQNGTSWALEFENEKQTCPVMVKDLEYPGHMLIEMLCNDHGRFLEIADVIHRLELTILKGAMERRSDESAWAHFIVEASESFHRLDIFWPLMQLLQQNRNQISSKI